MENIKKFLERLSKKNWNRVKDNKPAILDKVGEEITTEAMDKVLAEDILTMNTRLDNMLAKLDRCLEMQEKNIKTVEYINDIITK